MKTLIVTTFDYTKCTYGRKRKRTLFVDGVRFRPEMFDDDKDFKLQDEDAKAKGMVINNNSCNGFPKFYFNGQVEYGYYEIIEKLKALGFTGNVTIYDLGGSATEEI